MQGELLYGSALKSANMSGGGLFQTRGLQTSEMIILLGLP